MYDDHPGWRPAGPMLNLDKTKKAHDQKCTLIQLYS